jgi:predicted O-linked N-acetylglucosamine transferase (SPINDLY family)
MDAVLAVYREACDRWQVDNQRVQLVDMQPTVEKHRTIYAISDIVLDTHPFNGGVHSIESLWFGLPLVTRVGEQFMSRLGYSYLSSLGIEEGIAHTWDEFVEWGVKLGADRELREHVRRKLEQTKQPDTLAPLWNPTQFAGDMYALLQELAYSRSS